jgi:hypothetical protein
MNPLLRRPFAALGGVLLVLGASASASARAALVGSAYVFPSVANTAGLFGAVYQTKVTLYNPTNVNLTIQCQIATPQGASAVVNIPLQAGHVLQWDSFLDDVFHYTGGAGLIMKESTGTKPFLPVVEVHVDGPNGRFSTPVTGVSPDDAILTPAQSPGALFVAPGLQNNAGNRSNFGCLTVGPIASTVNVTFYAFTDGALTTAATSINLPAGSWQQQPITIVGDDIIAIFSLTSEDPGLVAYCYGVNVNDTSNDGNSIAARRTPPKP